jgi:protein ImuB
VQLWERANGNVTRPLKRVKPPEIFEEAFEFEYEIETSEPLLFILRRFLESFAVRLGAIYLVARELTLRITFSDKKVYEHTFKIPQPTNDVELLFRMLHTHLENFTSAAPIIAISLRAEPAKAAQQQFGLFETALRNPAQLAETLARLVALVGSDRVGTPMLIDTHEPDRFRIEPFRWELPAHSSSDQPLRAIALRRFRSAPEAIVLIDEGKPAHIRSSQINASVAKQNGPFLSSGNWWDENVWRRAEWDVQLEGGTVGRCHSDGERWRVDGIYD